MRKDYSMTNEKIQRINERTLIGGIDIAKDTHEIKWMNWRGEKIGKGMRFKNRRKDFEKVLEQIQILKQQTLAEQVIVAMEPTGVYGFALEEYLEAFDIEVVIVNGRDVKRTSEILGNDSSKNDARDAMIIGHLVNHGCYSYSTRLKEGEIAELDILMRRRETIKKDHIRFVNRLHKELAMLFPEYGAFKRDGISAGVLVLFKIYGTLERIIQAGKEGIYNCWRKHKVNGYNETNAQQFHKMAETSIGIKRNSQASAYTIGEYIDDYERSLKKLQAIDKKINEQLERLPQAQQLMAIPGIGPIIAAGLLTGIGDITRFTSPKQIQKLAGLAPVTNESGKHKGKDKSSKMGRKRLKSTLFQAGLCLITSNEAFKQLYYYYTQVRKNPLIKMKGVIVIACKLIRVIYAMLKNGTAYDEKKILAGSPLLLMNRATTTG